MNDHLKKMADFNYLGDSKYMNAAAKDIDTNNNTVYFENVGNVKDRELFDTQFKNTYFQNSFHGNAQRGLSHKIREQAIVEDLLEKQEAKNATDLLIQNSSQDVMTLVEGLNLTEEEKKDLQRRGYGDLI